MKGIYAHVGTEEPLGSEGRLVWQPAEGMDWYKAMKFMMKAFPGKSFTIYEFTNFYVEASYKQRYIYHGEHGMSPALM